jgi:hypothetical protein
MVPIVRASPEMLTQYVTLQEYFSHQSLVIYFFFGNPTNKIETGTANRWETTNSKSPGPSTSQIQFITLFSLQVHKVCCAFSPATTANCTIMVSQNHFPEPNRQFF